MAGIRDDDLRRRATLRRHAIDVAKMNRSAVVHIVARAPNRNDVIRRSNQLSGIRPNGDTAATGAVCECAKADRRVAHATLVAAQRFLPNSGVLDSRFVAKECIETHRRVVASDCVRIKRIKTNRRVGRTGGVGIEGCKTDGDVEIAFRIE